MFCPKCGKETVLQANFCSCCGAPVAVTRSTRNSVPIVRPRHPRMIAGVCSGIALHYGWDIAIVRILLAVFTFLTGGLGILVYIAAWIILPDALYTLPPNTYEQTPTERVV